MDPNDKFMITGTAYDRAKWLVQIFLPALGTFYYGVAEVMDWPGGEQVLAICGLLAVFLGTLLQISTKNYYNSDAPYDGDMVVVTDPETGGKTAMLQLNEEASTIVEGKSATFKVVDGGEIGPPD